MFKQYFLIEMLRGTARLVLPDTGRQTERGRKWKWRRRSCCCNQLNICSDSIWPGYCSWAYSTLSPSAALGICLVAPQNPRTTVCAPALRTTSSLRHLCSQFLPALQASWAEINYIEVIYQESLFLAGPRHRAAVPLPSLSPSLCLLWPKKGA